MITFKPQLVGRLGIGALISITMLAGCQSGGRVSVKEAQEIAVQFGGQSFTAPPRTTADITSILDSQKPDPAALARIKGAANRTAPSDLSARNMMRFFSRRAYNRMLIGRVQDGIEDYRTALKHGESVDIRNGRRDVMRTASLAEADMGNFKLAAKIIDQAISLQNFKSVGSTEVGARVFAMMGDVDEAISYALRSQALNSTAGTTDPVQEFRAATTAYVIAEAQGAWLDGEAFIKESIRAYQDSSRKSSIPNWVEQRRLHLAENLIRQDRVVEAESVVRDVLTSLVGRSGKFTFDVAKALEVFSRALIAEGRFAEAEAIAGEAINILKTIGVPKSSPYWGITHHTYGKALSGQGEWKAAVGAYDVVKTSLPAGSFHLNRLIADNLDVAFAYVRAGRGQQAIAQIENLLNERKTTFGGTSFEVAEAEAMLAIAQSSTGAGSGSKEMLTSAFARLAASDARLSSEQEIRLRNIAEAYLGVLADGASIEGSQISSAFVAAEIARGGIVRKALSASSARAAAGSPELVKLVRQLQDAEQQVAALEGHLANMVAAPKDQQVKGVAVKLTEKIATLRTAARSLRGEIDSRFPRYAQLLNPAPPDVKQTREMLDEGEAVLSYYFGDDKGYVFAIPKSGPARVAVLNIGLETLAGKVAHLRRALAPTGISKLADIPAFDGDAAHHLYQDLLEPVASAWKDAKHLMVVSHGALSSLPLTVLMTEQWNVGSGGSEVLFDHYKSAPWLARNHTVTGLPSVASLRTFRGSSGRKTAELAFAGFGDPFFNASQALESTKTASAGATRGGFEFKLRSAPQTRGVDSADLGLLPRLPDTRTEIASIAQALKADPARDLFLGKRATEEQVRTMKLDTYRVIAFATHGLVPGDLNGLNEPALALTSPDVTKGKGDGLLTMGEVMALQLNADWVVLSACNTAAAEGAGAEAVSGLGRAFFYAGTRALLVSNWPVHSGATTALTTDLFRRQAADPTLARAEAMRQTLTNLAETGGYKDASGQMLFSYAHPIFWAPFSLVGDGRGTAEAVKASGS
jgi:CHAT domain-containing protein